MSKSFSDSYKEAGVDVTAGYEAVDQIRPLVESTYTKGVLGTLGGFGGMFALDLEGIKEPVLVSGTDGVGTKLKIAFALNRHNTIGIDCVAMCVNDIICAGAKPLIFLDYIASAKTDPSVTAEIVSGIAEGCRQAGCALVGGETAEMPGFYQNGEYDLVGFSTGILDRAKALRPEDVKPGDALIGLCSTGLHSNGFSLARKVLGDTKDALNVFEPSLGMSVGEAMLTPTRIYVKPVLELLSKVRVHGISNITGGGWYENIPRMLPGAVTAKVQRSALPVPPIFTLIEERGGIPQRDMYNTFNMGLGMVLAIEKDDVSPALKALEGMGVPAALFGECVSGSGGIEIC